jgi:hypothetical protein
MGTLSISTVAQTNQIPPQEDIRLDLMTQSQARVTLLKSLVLPGWGEHSLAKTRRGYLLNSVDALLWITFAALELHGSGLLADMKAYATTHAGIQPARKDDYFFTDIGNYDSIYEYNEQKLRYRQSAALYDQEDAFWAWDSEASRLEFDDLRVRGNTALRNAGFAIAGLVLNRIVSVFDIILLTRNRLEKPDVELESFLMPLPAQMTLGIQIRF